MAKDIIEYIEFSGITRDRLKTQIEKTRLQAEKACQDGGIFAGKAPEEIAFCWFKNWLHCTLKHRKKKPDPAACNLETFVKQWNEYFYELGQFQFDYTMDTIVNYIESGSA